jgi:glycosyltransferase involved in cell wall biosynthesis
VTRVQPKISVILTTYNNAKYSRRAIESVLSQTYNNFELIIADDNSSDPEMLATLEEFKEQEKITFFNSFIQKEDRLKTARYATQINTAVRQYSTGDYLSYLADDDFFYPEMLERICDSINKDPKDIYYCCQEVVDTSGNKCGVRFPDKILDDGMDVLDHNQVITSRKAFDSVGGWDDDPGCWGGADGYFWRRLANAGYKFYPIEHKEPLQAKMYREGSVQWNIANGLGPLNESN